MANQDFTLAFWLKFPTTPSNYSHYLDLYPSATNNTRLAGKIVEAYEYDPYGRHILLRDGNAGGRLALRRRFGSGTKPAVRPGPKARRPARRGRL